MSAIASFHLIDDEKRNSLMEAAQAQARALTKKRWGILRPKLPLNPDRFWDFLWHNARELEKFPYSGYLFCDVELLAPGALSSEDEVGERLSEITQSTFVSYRPADAASAVNIVRAADFSEGTIKEFLIGEGRESDYPALVAPLQDSANHFTRWLEAVTDRKTGILHVG